MQHSLGFTAFVNNVINQAEHFGVEHDGQTIFFQRGDDAYQAMVVGCQNEESLAKALEMLIAVRKPEYIGLVATGEGMFYASSLEGFAKRAAHEAMGETPMTERICTIHCASKDEHTMQAFVVESGQAKWLIPDDDGELMLNKGNERGTSIYIKAMQRAMGAIDLSDNKHEAAKWN